MLMLLRQWKALPSSDLEMEEEKETECRGWRRGFCTTSLSAPSCSLNSGSESHALPFEKEAETLENVAKSLQPAPFQEMRAREQLRRPAHTKPDFK